jgi:hypothetical protein
MYKGGETRKVLLYEYQADGMTLVFSKLTTSVNVRENAV